MREARTRICIQKCMDHVGVGVFVLSSIAEDQRPRGEEDEGEAVGMGDA